ncbi:flagellar basal body rod protein [Salipaludibacillus keqinensis]|uniref:Flagellar basal body rod protein n=1 Tax=Salipaludibacillus keqinensis TaxID=2045207 RepID=A0A323TGQ1_9BACI|nr:flagellar basal body rod protein [Salipaludibacillus keqinensis]PYZ93650.1 flagellar basal body rod protein [Salipaludibacillus keqinensis]
MKTFLLFLAAIVALFVFLMNVGPLILLGVGVFLLYVIFKQFVKATTTGAKVMWIILGLIVLSMTVSNLFALVGLLALYVLYVMFRRGPKEEGMPPEKNRSTQRTRDPFTNFEQQWAELNK